jgi:hypothetical protein
MRAAVEKCGRIHDVLLPVGPAFRMPCYVEWMPVNSLHPDFEAMLPVWTRARDVIAGEDAVKVAGEKYLPRLTEQADPEKRTAANCHCAVVVIEGRKAEGEPLLSIRIAAGTWAENAVRTC